MVLLTVTAYEILRWVVGFILCYIYLAIGGIVATSAPNLITAILTVFFWPLGFAYDAIKKH